MWQAQAIDVCSMYVKQNIEHHIRSALDVTEEHLPPCIEEWICHWPHQTSFLDTPLDFPDEIVAVARRILGLDRLAKVRDAALEKGDDWLVLMGHEAWLSELGREVGPKVIWEDGKYSAEIGKIMPVARRIIFEQRYPQRVDAAVIEHVSLHYCLAFDWISRGMGEDGVLKLVDGLTKEDLASFQERLIFLLENTHAGRVNPNNAEKLKREREISRLQKAGSWAKLDPMLLENWKRENAEATNLVKFVSGHRAQLPAWFRLPEWDWQIWDSCDVLGLWCSYDPATDAFTDGHILPQIWPGIFISALRGDIAAANTGLDFTLEQCRTWMSALSGPHSITLQMRLIGRAARHLPLALMALGRHHDVSSLLTELDITWSTADGIADTYCSQQGGFRKRGITGIVDGMGSCVEEVSWMFKLNYVMATTWREVPPDDVIATLPSPDQMESYIINISPDPGGVYHYRQFFNNLLLLAAEVCEKLQRPEDSLLYLAKVLRTDHDDPSTDQRPTTSARGKALQGRMLATQGKKDEAEAAFEEAIEVSQRTGLRLLEMFAVRDLKKHILDADGRGEEGSKRLKAVLKDMKGPPAELTKLLGGGLDAEVIMRS
jgi:tetratricopeptide (TPR) repeat protein